MEIAKVKQMFKTTTGVTALPTKPQQAAKVTQTPHTDYMETMLQECQSMVKALAKLNESQLKILRIEVHNVLNDLTKWQDNYASVNAIELFASMRNLKQKANNLRASLNSQKSANINNAALKIIKNPIAVNMLTDNLLVNTEL